MRANFQHTFELLLDDGTPAAETLEILHSQIADFLIGFDVLLK